ncbi:MULTISPECIES: hypothetical protein [unclassified Nocardia]|uniref:hypothetical protein n=1 Tax=unclassified Nocardia TaxID=2637762 RepID=UPI00278C7CBB|nr:MULTISPECIES: hypothetical protein [unclassified Nocardia]
MSSGERPEDDRYAYSTSALARLVLSEQMREVADHAASLVPTIGDRGLHGGEMVAAARGLLNMAQEAMVRAVLYERSRHTSWETIGEVLEITRQSAHAKFREDEQEWKEALQEPFYESAGPIRNLRLPEAAFQPTVAGQRLDKWAVKHCDEEDHSVTGGLPTLSTIEEMNQVLAALTHLYSDMFSPIDQEKHARLLERKAGLLDRIATEEGRPEAAQQAAEARARAAELRAQPH